MLRFDSVSSLTYVLLETEGLSNEKDGVTYKSSVYTVSRTQIFCLNLGKTVYFVGPHKITGEIRPRCEPGVKCSGTGRECYRKVTP